MTTLAECKKVLDIIAGMSHQAQLSAGVWSEEASMEGADEGDDAKIGNFFAMLHSQVSRAYLEYTEGAFNITWSNMITGEECPPWEGLPDGLIVSLSKIATEALGLMNHLGFPTDYLVRLTEYQMKMLLKMNAEVAGNGSNSGEEHDEGNEDSDPNAAGGATSTPPSDGTKTS